MPTPDLLTLLNEGDRQTLLSLPGIGPALADRLLQERPFLSLEDCAQRVRGLSLARLEALAAHLDEQAAAAPDAPSAAQRETFKSRASKRLEVAVSQGRQTWAQLEAGWQNHADDPITLRTLIWGLGLALLFTLALVRIGNLRLERRLRADNAPLYLQIEGLQTEVAAMRARVQALDDIHQRTAALEAEQEALQADLDEMQTRLDEMSASLERQARANQQFTDFLQSLRELLNALFVTPGGSQ